MRSIKAIGLAIVAVLALGAITASAASATEFEASKPGALAGHQLNTQVFSTEGASNVECKTAKTTGEVKEGETKSHTVTVKVAYSGCSTFFGLFSASVSEAEYTFHVGSAASENYATVDNTIKIEAAGCTITVSPTGNSKLQTVAYKNNSGKVIEETNITGIESTTEGSEEVCGEDGTHANGSYSGNNEVELVEGEISVK